MSHKKFGPDRFSRFDVYWIQTDRQTTKQTDKPNLYIDTYRGLASKDLAVQIIPSVIFYYFYFLLLLLLRVSW